MGFADWAKRSNRYQATAIMHGISFTDARELAQAAYKAGEREGRKQVERVAVNAINFERFIAAKIAGRK